MTPNDKGGEAAADPFTTARCGGSPKTAISPAATSTAATIRRRSPSAPQTLSSVPATGSCCEAPLATPPLSGGDPSTGETTKWALNAPCSETKGRTYRRSLSDRLTLSLIRSGLVKGITPSSVRRQSGLAILDIVSWPQAGADAATPRAGCSSSKGLAHD
jgi:hypothetical protein